MRSRHAVRLLKHTENRMHRTVSAARRKSLWQRAFALVVAVCLLFPGASPAAIAWDGQEPGCTGAVYQPGDCTHGNQRSAGEGLPSEVETLPGTPGVPIRRSYRRWFGGAARDDGTVSAVWLETPAHDPAKTVRFCTLLI